MERNLLLRWHRHVHEKVNEWGDKRDTEAIDRVVIISEESEIRLSVHF